MKYLQLIILLILFSCTNNTSSSKRVELFNNTYINLENGEKVLEITPDAKERYLHTFSHSLQIPLYRYIGNKDYELFIGIPYNTSLNEFIAAYSDSIGIETTTDSSTYFYALEKSDSAIIVNYTKLLDKNMITLITVSKSINNDSLLSVMALSKRIHINE